jgi:hypothetical protein
MESVREALDLLLRDGAITGRQHRKLARAEEYLERSPSMPAPWWRRLAVAFRRPAEIDLLGMRVLRGELSETAFSARLKIDSIVVAAGWGIAMLVVFGAQGFWNSPGRWGMRGPVAALLASSAMFGVLFYLLLALPMGVWWSRLYRRLDELRAQREAGGDV